MSDDLVTISAKVPRGLRDKLDGIGDDLRLSNRSVLIRKALESFVESRESVGIPPVESKIDARAKRILADREMLGIPRGNETSSSTSEEGNGEK
ncbi:MAG: hypothetical protein KAW84_02560 [Thermoplasmata archaeon]|nr:hypothetical protein [Thermoplasmata archaeon]